MSRFAPLLLTFLAAVAALALADAQTEVGAAPDDRDLPRVRPVGELEVVAAFDEQMPTGVAVSKSGRVFVCFPRWGDAVEFTLAEVKDGEARPYPDAEFNDPDGQAPGERLISVQSVVVDPADRLWALDTASIQMTGPIAGGAKLVRFDLETDEVAQTIILPETVALPTTYLNDVRFDLRRGEAGIAYITDSSAEGPNGIIVVDLASGRSWRKLDNHPSTRPELDFVPMVEGRVLLNRPEEGTPSPLNIGADGIALSADGRRLFYCPLSGTHLWSANTDALADPTLTDVEVAQGIIDHGAKGASDGLEADSEGRIYLTEYQQNAILRWSPDGSIETLAGDPRLLWPDTLALGPDGWLYVTANQLHRQARFHGGEDEREKPYVLFRLKVDAEPVSLNREEEG